MDYERIKESYEFSRVKNKGSIKQPKAVPKTVVLPLRSQNEANEKARLKNQWDRSHRPITTAQNNK